MAADGYTRFAGLNAQDGSGRGFYYVCSPNAESYLMLAGTGHPAGYFQVQIDGRGFQLPFVQQGDQLTLGILPYAEFLNLLARGRHLAVTNSAGIPVLQLSLAGAARAIPEARSGCGY